MSGHAAVPSSPFQRLLGPPGAQRLRLTQSLLAWTLFLVFAGIQHLEVLLGLMDGQDSNTLSTFNLLGATGFVLLIRSGWNQRLAPKDPALTVAQMLFAMVSITWSYSITGPARGLVIAIAIVILLFSSFQLRPRQARLVSLTGFLMLCSAMAWRALGPGPRYPAEVELVHALFTAVVIGATAVLSMRLSRLRARLSAQKTALEQALEVNRELATRDGLTGLLNRRAMLALLNQQRPYQRRTEGAMALAMLDLDHFKRINDQHGHQVGDAVLQRFAELARSQLRAGDTLARWGGEEFLLLMQDTTEVEALVALERVRQRIVAGRFDELAAGLQPTFSAGLAAYQGGEPCAAVIERADQALYRAKHNGRNRVETAAPPL
jgi:diguanylate cyclase (GGDEF)-like protein